MLRDFRNFLKKYFLCLLLLIFLIPSFMSLTRAGFFTMYDDMQVIRLHQMDLCFKDRQIPCRWVPDLGYGYGYPLFQYYAPLPYYVMELTHLAGFSFIGSVKIGFILSILLSGYIFFFFLRKIFPSSVAFLGSLLYVYIPIRAADIYVRGAMGEAWGFVTTPLIFYSFEKFLNKRNYFSMIFLSVSFFLFLISHNLTILMMFPFFVLWIIARVLNVENRFEVFKKTLVSLGLGVFLAGFYVVPLIFEKDLVHLETLTQGYFDYNAHFASLRQLFFSFHWGYGPSILGPNDEVSLSSGPLQILLSFCALLFSLIFKNRKIKLASFGLFLILTLSLFLSHQRSVFIWQRVEFLKYLQFPWRFLVLSAFVSSVLSSFLFSFSDNKKTKFILPLICILVLVIYSPFFKPKDWFYISDDEKLSGQYLERQITASIYDYLPKSAKVAPFAKSDEGLIITRGEIEEIERKRGTNWFYYKINVISEAAEVSIPTFDFPGLKIKVNGFNAEYRTYGELGHPTIKLNKGENIISTNLGRSFARYLGDLLSLSGAGIVIGGFFYRKKRKK